MAIWEGRDKTGRSFLDHVPREIISRQNDSELKLILKNGSLIRLVGTDNVDAIMGTPPSGAIFSEYSLQKPSAWDYIRPILLENKGWALFNGTPRGKNHFYDLWLTNRDSPDWYVSLLTIDDTGAISKEDIDREKEQGMSDEIAQQEFYCNFTRGQEGTWYGKYLAEVESDGRITNVPHDPYSRVDTFWDLGVGDSTSIIFAQRVQNEIHIIDYYENNGLGLDHYAQVLDDRKYKYGTHYAPHDIKVRELGSGARTRLDIARDLGISFQIVPDLNIFEGIELTRSIFKKLWFDQTKCSRLIKCLENYCKVYNELYNVYSDMPLHNWASHAADSARMLGITYARSTAYAKTLEEIEWEDRKYSKRGK
jgi:phage terminase large subunit